MEKAYLTEVAHMAYIATQCLKGLSALLNFSPALIHCKLKKIGPGDLLYLLCMATLRQPLFSVED